MANYVSSLKTFRCLDLSRMYNLQNTFQYKNVKKKRNKENKLIYTEHKQVVAKERGGRHWLNG